MNLFEITSTLMVLTALFSYINYRLLRLPTTIGVMFVALAFSLGLVTLSWLKVEVGQDQVASMLETIDFNQALLHGMLSFLLFAGALHIKFDDLANQKWPVTILATVGSSSPPSSWVASPGWCWGRWASQRLSCTACSSAP